MRGVGQSLVLRWIVVIAYLGVWFASWRWDVFSGVVGTAVVGFAFARASRFVDGTRRQNVPVSQLDEIALFCTSLLIAGGIAAACLAVFLLPVFLPSYGLNIYYSVYGYQGQGFQWEKHNLLATLFLGLPAGFALSAVVVRRLRKTLWPVRPRPNVRELTALATVVVAILVLAIGVEHWRRRQERLYRAEDGARLARDYGAISEKAARCVEHVKQARRCPSCAKLALVGLEAEVRYWQEHAARNADLERNYRREADHAREPFPCLPFFE